MTRSPQGVVRPVHGFLVTGRIMQMASQAWPQPLTSNLMGGGGRGVRDTELLKRQFHELDYVFGQPIKLNQYFLYVL